MSMSPGDGAKLASAVERMAAALEQGNKLQVQQGARLDALALELFYLRMMAFNLVKLLFPDLKGELEAMLDKLTPPAPPKVLKPEPEEQELSLEEIISAKLDEILKTPANGRAPLPGRTAASGAPPQRQRPPQTGHQQIPQGARLGQSFRDRLKTQGAQTPQKAPKMLVPEPDDEAPEEGVDLRKFAKAKPDQAAQ